MRSADPCCVRLLKAGEEPAWDNYVANHPDRYKCYSFTGWKKTIENTFNLATLYFHATGPNGETRGIFPVVHQKSLLFGNFMVSLPFLPYASLLADDESVTAMLIDRAVIEARARGAEQLEIRSPHKLPHGGRTLEHKITMEMVLRKNPDEVMKGFSSNLRNHIRRSMKNGFEVEIWCEPKGVDYFYPVWSNNMRRLGTPVLPRTFFQEAMVQNAESVRIFIVKAGNTVAGAAFTVKHGNRFEVPWVSCDPAYFPKYVNLLLYWKMMEYGSGCGCDVFDFGRSSKESGTQEFKRRWGSEEIQLYWEYPYVRNRMPKNVSPSNARYNTMISIWKRLPLSVTNTIGPFIVRGIP